MRPFVAALVLMLGGFAGWWGWTAPGRHGLPSEGLPSRAVPDPATVASELLQSTRARIDSLPAGEDVTPLMGLAKALEGLGQADLESDWIEPTPDSMRAWLLYRMEGIQDFVRDNGIEALVMHGWAREWPPAEGFLTEYDLDRLARTGMEAFSRAQRFKLFEHLTADLCRHSPDHPELAELRRTYRALSEMAWAEVFEGDPYPFDVLALCFRVGLE